MLDFFETELTFHGTDSPSGAHIISGRINLNLGGGELGRGFYTGNNYHNARAIAFYKAKENFDSMAVVLFHLPVEDLVFLNVCQLERRAARYMREHIKRHGQQRQYLFQADAVEAPIVGKHLERARQYKWESLHTQNLLNSGTVLRRLVDDRTGFRYYLVSRQ